MDGAGYSVFIPGETVDLCVPSIVAVERDGWADWFNDAGTTHSLDQGVWPVTLEQQREFYHSLRADRTRLVLLICSKSDRDVTARALGVVSLSQINLMRRSAEIALVLPSRAERPSKGELPLLRGLEAMALMTQHGFERLGLERIGAGQVFPFQRGFNRKLELLGYWTEGVLRHAFAKGRNHYDVFKIACLHERYEKIVQLREGKLWPGNAAMHELIKELPKTSFADMVKERLDGLEQHYFDSLRLV
jgi:RimJ/RimL family protein N-acetyltransferase